MLREGVLQPLSNNMPPSPRVAIRVGAAADDLPADAPNGAGAADALLSLAEPMRQDHQPSAAVLPQSDQAARLEHQLRQLSVERKPAPAGDAGAKAVDPYPEVPIAAFGAKLCRAVMWGDDSSVLHFIHSAPFRLDEWGDDGRSALQIASCIGDKRMVVSLLKGCGGVGADINQRSSFGLTAAHFAAAKGYVRVLDSLIRAGADLAARTAFNATPLDLARCNGWRHTEDLLLAQNAPPGGLWGASADVQARVRAGCAHPFVGPGMMATLLGVSESHLFVLCPLPGGRVPLLVSGAGPGNRQ